MSVLKIWDETNAWGYASYWRNLIVGVSEEYVDWRKLDNKYELLNNELQKYNARLDILDPRVEEIIFDSEEDMTWFILRWS